MTPKWRASSIHGAKVESVFTKWRASSIHGAKVEGVFDPWRQGGERVY